MVKDDELPTRDARPSRNLADDSDVHHEGQTFGPDVRLESPTYFLAAAGESPDSRKVSK
jgi:hypothetical protein